MNCNTKGGLIGFIILVLSVYTFGNNDPHVFHPCPHLDVECIKQYFLSSGACSPPAGRIPDPLRLPFKIVYLPNFNASLLQEDLVIRGMKSDIVEFYINKETNRAVLAFRVKDFDTETRRGHFTYLLPTREPITATTTIMEKNGTVLFTVVFEGTRPLNLRNSFAHAVVEVLPELTIGIHPLAVKDRGYQAMFSGIFSDLRTAYREGYLTAASFYSNIVIQCTLCDFGIRDSADRWGKHFKDGSINQNARITNENE